MTVDDLYRKYFKSEIDNMVCVELDKAIPLYDDLTKDFIIKTITKIIDELSYDYNKNHFYYFSNKVRMIPLYNKFNRVMVNSNNPHDSYKISDLILVQTQKHKVKHLLESIPNTIESFVSLIEIDALCVSYNRLGIKDIINTKYSELDETDQFTVTLATGYRTQ